MQPGSIPVNIPKLTDGKTFDKSLILEVKLATRFGNVTRFG
jgi:hypothetical protein